MLRGVAGFPILRDDMDRFVFLDRARKQFDGDALQCLVWALMINHGHLVARTKSTPLSVGMHRLDTEYASYFNRRYQRQGHVFQNRFKSLLIDEETYLLRAVRYVLLNPVKGGIVAGLDELETYPWTSYPALMTRSAPRLGDVDFTLRLFADGREAARRELRQWMLDGIKNQDPFELLVELSSGRPPKALMDDLRAALIGERDSYVVGDSAFISSVLATAKAPRPAMQRFAGGWGIDTLLARVCQEMDVDGDEIRLGRRFTAASDARGATAWLGVTYLGFSMTDLAFSLGVTRPAISKALSRGRSVARERLSCLLDEVAGQATVDSS